MRKSKNILLAMDYSRFARNAERFLKELRLPAGSHLYILNVIAPPKRSQFSNLGPRADWGKYASQVRAHMFKNARRFVHRVQRRFEGENLKLHALVSEGRTVNEILSVVDQYNIDMVAVGHQGLTGIRRFLVGSVSEDVLNHASCSALMVRTAPNWIHHKQTRGMRVLVAVDKSFQARAALEFVRLIDFPPRSSVELLHVLEPFVDTNIEVPPEIVFPDVPKLLAKEKQIWSRRERKGVILLKNLQDKFRKRGCSINTNRVLGKGYPADVIITEAKSIQADLIIIGSKGLQGIQRFLLGSVSRKVVRHAPCSVLVVRQGKSR